jgi:dipeptidase D
LNILKDIEPKKVFHYFEEISSIPRGSKNEKEISDYLVNFAKCRGIEVLQDEYLNVIIKKPATQGYESVPTIILQGHIDMVWEKNQDTNFDFYRQGIKLKVVGNWVSAIGTTLGADNGIAVAFALAILDSDDIPHPALEILLTSDEETGMTGAKALNGKNLKGKYLINIDTEEEGALYVSCAGGLRANLSVPFDDIKTTPDNFFIIKLSGLKGGHSGADIHLQRGNSIKIMGNILKELSSKFDLYLVDIFGGSKMNAIPRESNSVISLESSDIEIFKQTISLINSQLKDKFYSSDPNIELTFKKVLEGFPKRCLNKISTEKLINTILLHPNGVQSMSQDINGLVESSINLGIIKLHKGNMVMESAIRSSTDWKIDLISDNLRALENLTGGYFKTGARYPAWKYQKNSKLREHMSKVYTELFEKKPEIKAIHAGLECGLLGEKLPDTDMISFGPDIIGAHTPQEKLSISSTKRSWNFLLEVLKTSKDSIISK